MPFTVNSNFADTLQHPDSETAKRLWINSVDYTNHVEKWPKIKREWDSVRSATVSISLVNASQLFNFFHTDKTRIKDTVNIDYGVKFNTHNLLGRSSAFNHSSWQKIRLNIVTNDIANPINGDIDAEKAFVDTSSNNHYMRQNVIKRLPFEEADYWCTAYVKPAESLAFRFHIDNNGVGSNIFFDVESGTVLTAANSYSDHFIRQETNGWYRCGAKFTAQGSDDISVFILPTHPSSKQQEFWDGDGSAGMYFYGAMLREAQYSNTDAYFMTGGVRFEPFGMNLAKYTEQFSSSTWVQGTGISVSQNAEVAPDGNTTADTIVNSDNSVAWTNYQQINLTAAERIEQDYWCASVYAKQGTAMISRVLFRMFDQTASTGQLGRNVYYTWPSSAENSFEFRASGTSGMPYISNGGVEGLDDGWVRFWTTIKQPKEFIYDPTLAYDRLRFDIYPAASAANSGSTHFWGFQIEKGGPELLDGPGPYIEVSTTGVVYPSNAEDMIDLFDGTVRDAAFSRGKLKLTAKDKFRFLSEQIVGTGEVPIAINSITPSWLAFTLCSCYGGLDNTQSTANTDIDWAAVNSWDSHNTSNTVHVKTDFRGMKVTEALKRIARMTRTAIYIEEDLITFRRFTNISTQIFPLNNNNLVDVSLSVNDEDLVNKQWVFGDWEQNSEFYQIALFDEDTASQNSYGLHERVLKDQSIFYVSSNAMLDTAQRIVANEAEPIDRLSLNAIPSALRMKMGESISVDDPELNVAGTYRIMGTQIDMNKDEVRFMVDNSQLILGQTFILGTSSLGGTDLIT